MNYFFWLEAFFSLFWTNLNCFIFEGMKDERRFWPVKSIICTAVTICGKLGLTVSLMMGKTKKEYEEISIKIKV